MQSPQDPRIDLAELKVHIVKKVGVERSRRYFYYLGRFLNQKLSKSEFDMSCNRFLGKENLALHNKLIRSILRNASLAKSPPPVHKTGQGDKSLVVVGKEDGPDHSRNGPVWSNGVLTKVRPSRLGPNGKVDSVLHRQQGLEERGRLILSSAASSVTAPLGIPSCSASVGGTRRAVPTATTAVDFISCYGNGGLLDTEMVRKRIENIAAAQGLGGVSAECSSILNSMLDVYLKKLIKSCVDLAGDDRYVSLLDLRVAMELNPQQLGVDWPLLRERISTKSFEEREGV